VGFSVDGREREELGGGGVVVAMGGRVYTA
jgi:hypothetical protein